MPISSLHSQIHFTGEIQCDAHHHHHLLSSLPSPLGIKPCGRHPLVFYPITDTVTFEFICISSLIPISPLHSQIHLTGRFSLIPISSLHSQIHLTGRFSLIPISSLHSQIHLNWKIQSDTHLFPSK